MMTFKKVADEILEQYESVWIRLAHHDTLCKGTFVKIEGRWFVCDGCGTSYEEEKCEK